MGESREDKKDKSKKDDKKITQSHHKSGRMEQLRQLLHDMQQRTGVEWLADSACNHLATFKQGLTHYNHCHNQKNSLLQR